ncbi:MAG: hypothetical protein VX100_07485 [Pseudomonadota bacterium]|nr:hypothetical protein [Pseudomonadota bacterium]
MDFGLGLNNTLTPTSAPVTYAFSPAFAHEWKTVLELANTNIVITRLEVVSQGNNYISTQCKFTVDGEVWATATASTGAGSSSIATLIAEAVPRKATSMKLEIHGDSATMAHHQVRVTYVPVRED